MKKVALIVLGALLLALPLASFATTGNSIVVTATSGVYSNSYTVDMSLTDIGDDSGIGVITSDGTANGVVLGTFKWSYLTDASGYLSYDFTVISASTTDDTTFTIVSTISTPLTAVDLSASADLSVRDSNRDGTASLVGAYNNKAGKSGYAFTGSYTKTSGVETSDGILASAKVSKTGGVAYCQGDTDLGDEITSGVLSASGTYEFTLSKGDSAVGQVTLSATPATTPEPGSLAGLLTGVLGIAGVTLRRKTK